MKPVTGQPLTALPPVTRGWEQGMAALEDLAPVPTLGHCVGNDSIVLRRGD